MARIGYYLGMAEMTVRDAAQVLGFSEGYIRKLVQRGALAPSVHYTGRLLLFSPDEIERYRTERKPRGRPRKMKEG